MQPKVTYPAVAVVARAYIDQLNRTKGIAADRARAVAGAMDRAEALRTPSDRGAAEAAAELTRLAGQLDADAARATGRDQMRLRALSDTLTTRAARLR